MENMITSDEIAPPISKFNLRQFHGHATPLDNRSNSTELIRGGHVQIGQNAANSPVV